MADPFALLKKTAALALKSFPAWDVHSEGSNERRISEYEGPERKLLVQTTNPQDIQPSVKFAHDLFLDEEDDSSSDEGQESSPSPSRPTSVQIQPAVQPVALQLLPSVIVIEEEHPAEEVVSSFETPTFQEEQAGSAPTEEQAEFAPTEEPADEHSPLESEKEERPSPSPPGTEAGEKEKTETPVVREEAVASATEEPVVVLKFKPRVKTRCVMSEIEEADPRRETDSFVTSQTARPEEVIVPVLPVMERSSDPPAPHSFEHRKNSVTEDTMGSKKCCTCVSF